MANTVLGGPTWLFVLVAAFFLIQPAAAFGAGNIGECEQDVNRTFQSQTWLIYAGSVNLED
jgi:hypothetical protein